MSVENGGRPRSAHVVVFGNEKGGSGKSTVAMHVAVALMKAGQRVATIDLRFPAEKLHPLHRQPPRLGQAHSMADTLISPLNDSFVDFDVLGTVDPATFAVTGTSHFAEMVREARRQRRIVDHATTDWVVVRNRLSMLGSRNKRLVGEGLNELALRLGFRCVDGFAERVIFREFFPRGLTALDSLDETTLGTRPSMSHVTARQEVENLLAALKLPFDERGLKRAAARAEWFAAADQPLELHDILAN